MGTYYRWRKSSVKYSTKIESKITSYGNNIIDRTNEEYISVAFGQEIKYPVNDLYMTISDGARILVGLHDTQRFAAGTYVHTSGSDSVTRLYKAGIDGTAISISNGTSPEYTYDVKIHGNFYRYTLEYTADTFIGYVYNKNSNAYPVNRPKNGYYYDQRTTVISPTNPSSITFGTPKAGESLTITAGAATDVVGSGSLTYVFERQIDNGSWTQVAATYNKTITDGVPGSGEYINYRVKARDKNGVESSYYTGTKKPIEYPILITDPGIPQYKYPISGKEMLVTWDPSAIPEKAPLTYIVEKQIDSEPWGEVARVSENSYTFTVPEVTAEGKRLTIRVKATDAGGNESKYSTGKATEILYHKVIRLIPWTFGIDFRVRQFTKNSRSQYQTMLAGSTAEIIATGNLRLGDMPLETLIRYGRIRSNDIVWKTADINHKGYPENTVTLTSNQYLKHIPYDAGEPDTPDTFTFRDKYGNNRYKYSNARQWMNSDKPGGQWFTKQHTYDTPPTLENYSALSDPLQYPIADDPGFLYEFTEKEKSILVPTIISYAISDYDGGGTETCTDKIFLASPTELGLVEDYVCGVRFPIFYDRNSRVTTPVSDIQRNQLTYWLRGGKKNSNSAEAYALEGNDGDIYWYWATRSFYYFRPFCNISADTMLDPNPNPDGSYNIVWE